MKPKHIFLKIISVYQILGGLAGVAVIFFSIFPVLAKQSGHPHIGFLYFITILFLLLFIVSIVAGIFLWMNKSCGYLLSFIVQLLQIPHIMVSYLIYIFIAGFSLAPYIASKGFGMTFYLGGRFLFYVGQVIPGFQVGINLVALFLAIWIFVAWKRFKRNA